MTDKEQIKADERAGCKHYCLGECSREFGNTNGNCVGTIKCIDNLIEQLARKTVECEKLEEENNRFCDERVKWVKCNTSYRKALEEIEGLAMNLRTRTDYHSLDEVNVDIENILDIILEAKGEKNAR